MTRQLVGGDRRIWAAALAITAGGIALRLQQFALHRAFWIDEAMLAYGLDAPGTGIIGALPYDQVAPPGFLLLARLLTALPGPAELLLRAPALISGCAALVICVLLARRVGGVGVALIVAISMAFSPAAVYYSQEFKPYACDMLLAAAIPLLAMRAEDRRATTWRRLAYVVVCAIGPLVSTSAVLVACGVAPLLALASIRRRDWRGARWQCMATGFAGLTFGLSFWTNLRFARHSEVMSAFWKGAFLDIGSVEGLMRTAELLRRVVWGLLIGPPPSFVWWVNSDAVATVAFSGLAVLALGCAAAGAVRLIRLRRSLELLCLAGPLAALAASSLTHSYPTAARLLLFAFVPVAVLAAVAIGGVAGRPTSPVALAAGTVCVGIIGALAMPLDLRWRLSDVQWSNAEALVSQALRRGRPVYINARGVPQFLYYARVSKSIDGATAEALYEVSRYGGAAFENSDDCFGGATVALRCGPTGTLLVGSPNGMRFEYMSGWNRLEACAGWAQRESRRLGENGAEASLVILHHIDKAGYALLDQLAQDGWKCSLSARQYDEMLADCERRSVRIE